MSKLFKGTITLVGAGPGDPELITLKGLRVLQKAEVILYDSLINPILLDYNHNAEKIFVGKRSGRLKKSQKEINKLLVFFALNGKNVIRLKGGDPMVFGRAYEELGVAKKFDIPTQVVPGISSYAGIAAQHQIPLTQRGKQGSFWVVTGHTEKGGISADLHLAVQSSATVIVLMGMRFLEEIVGVFKEFKPSDYPVAIIENGTTSVEKTLVTNLYSLIKKVNEYQIQNPALLIFGTSCTDAITKYQNTIAKEICLR